nr:MAG TPA: hypothetical protein [Bacteriophage sp.]
MQIHSGRVYPYRNTFSRQICKSEYTNGGR